ASGQDTGRPGRTSLRRRASRRPLLRRRRDASENALRLVSRSGGEVEGVRRPRSSAVAEGEPPQPVELDRLTVTAPKRAAELPMAIRAMLVRVDLPVPEVPDQQIAAGGGEVGGSERQAPGRIEGALGRDASEELPARVEHVDEAGPGAGDVDLLVLVGLRIGDEDRAVDVLDAERRE